MRGIRKNTGQMVGSIQVMLQCPLQPTNSWHYGAAMLFVAGMQRARWDARCTLGCVVHAGMRGSRWYAWFTLGCVVHAGMRGARWDARCKADAHASIALRACAQYRHNGMICVLMLCEPRLDETIESATGPSKH
jgi:hypothetical protein